MSRNRKVQRAEAEKQTEPLEPITKTIDMGQAAKVSQILLNAKSEEITEDGKAIGLALPHKLSFVSPHPPEESRHIFVPIAPTFEHTVIRCRPGDFDKTALDMMGWELVSASPMLERVPGGQSEVYVTFWKRLKAKETP